MPDRIDIIAETAFSHEGEFQYLLKQIDAAHQAEADYVKFQVIIDKRHYCTQSSKVYDIIDQWIFTSAQWLEAFEYARSKKLGIVVLPLDTHSLEFCLEHDKFIDIYEVHSICFNEYLMLNMLKETKKKILLGVGGQLPEEVDYAVSTLDKKSDDIILMFGFQSFPTQKETLNLGKLASLRDDFECSVGYADHSAYNDDSFHAINQYAYMLGARCFEKHIVLEKGVERIDYESGIVSSDFVEMRKRLTELQSVLGDADLTLLNDKELKYKSREKQIVASRDIESGELLQMGDLMCKFTEDISDFSQRDFLDLLNKKVVKRIEFDEPIKRTHLN